MWQFLLELLEVKLNEAELDSKTVEDQPLRPCFPERRLYFAREVKIVIDETRIGIK